MAKGVEFDKIDGIKGDQKDYIISNFKTESNGIITGYVDDKPITEPRMLPAMDFPSDHYIVTATITI